MAEAAIEFIGAALLNAGAETLGATLIFEAGAIATGLEVLAVAASVYTLREQQRRARNAYNNGLTDRYVMQRTATGQRQLVLGRARVSGPITFLQSYGDNRTTLAMVVTLAGHECDGIEDIYFNDTPVILDGSGNVVGTKNIEHFSISGTTATFTLGAVGTAGTASAVATYDTGDVSLGVTMSGDGKTLSVTGGVSGKVGSVVVTYQPYEVVYTPTRIEDSHQEQTASGSTGTFTVPSNCITASAVVVDIAPSGAQTAIGFSRSGNTITYTGATAGHRVHLMYQAGTTYSRARIRKYLGAPGQTADVGLISALPALWTSNHRGDGLCYLVIELDYDPSTFPNGIPNVSAVVRGLKCYDPRTSTTAWTDNPALLMRGYYLHPLGANRSSSEIDDTAVIAAANVCDGSVTYTVGTHKRTTARYKASTVAAKDRRPQDVLTDLAHAMGGRWVISGNQLVVKAGAYTSPVASIDETWLHNGTGVSIQPRPNRADLTNSISGSFADEEQAWQTVAYPKVAPSAYITADGNELPSRIDYPAVTYSGQAQYLSSCQIRYNRAGLTVRMSCNLRAFPLEVFDVVSVSLSRFGWVNKTFEVVSTSFTVDGLVDLTLKEIDSSIWALDAAYSATDYAAKTQLPSPWRLPVPVLGTPVSGTSYLLKQADGSIVSRIYVPITVTTDLAVLQGGFIDVSYTRAGDPDQSWYTVTVPGDASGAFLSGVQDKAAYLIKARYRNRLAEGNWSQQIVHQVVGKTQPPSDVSGLAATVIPGAVHITWTLPTDVDYSYTVLRYGASWAAGTTLPFNSPGSSYDWPSPTPGTYTIWAAHVDTTGNLSASPQSTSVVVTTVALYPANASLSIKLNVNDFAGTTNYSEAYLHGRDSTGNPADVPGTILINGVATPVPNGRLVSDKGPIAGYIVWDSSGSTFTTGPGPQPYVLARRYQGQWQYDNNSAGGDGWTTFTPTPTHWIIGTLESGAPDTNSPPGLVAASIWAAATTLNALEAGADAAYANAVAAIPRGTINSDPGLLDAANSWEWVDGVTVSTVPSIAPGALGVRFFACATPANKFAWTKQTYPISAARTYTLNALLYAGSGNDRNMYLVVDMYKADGTRLSGADTGWGGTYAGYVFGGLPTADQFTRYGGDFGAGTVRPIPASAAYFRIGVWFQYDPGSTSINQAAEDIRLADVTEARVASVAAAAAQGDASSALSTLATMRSNGYLDASEKPTVIKAWQAISDERAGIYAQGTTYGLTSLRNSYQSAYDALASYLTALTPSWSDTTTDTPITPATDQATWAAYYSARQTLLNAVADETAKRAQWSQVSGSGKPLDNAGQVIDTRSANDPPSAYPVGNVREFKTCAAIGLSTTATYCILETIKGWADSSGGEATQWAYVTSGEIWKRSAGGGASSWGAWVRDLDRALYTGDLAATQNQVFYQDTDPTVSPGGVVNGAIWISSTKAWQRVSGAWQPYVGAGSVDTTQLANAAATVVSIVNLTGIGFNNTA